MTARSRSEEHRASTPLELFFDLCFVVAVAQAGGRLVHAVAEGHVGPVYTILIIGVVRMEDSVEYTSLVRVHAMHILGGYMFTAHIRAMRRSDPVIPERHGSGWWNRVL